MPLKLLLTFWCFLHFRHFLVACMQLYKPLCWLVHPSVGRCSRSTPLVAIGLVCICVKLDWQADTHFIYTYIFASLLPGSWSWDSCKSGRTAWPCTHFGTPEERQAGKIIAKIKKIDDKLPFFSFFLDCSSHHKLRKTCHIECCPKKQGGQRYMEVSYV